MIDQQDVFTNSFSNKRKTELAHSPIWARKNAVCTSALSCKSFFEPRSWAKGFIQDELPQVSVRQQQLLLSPPALLLARAGQQAGLSLQCLWAGETWYWLSGSGLWNKLKYYRNSICWGYVLNFKGFWPYLSPNKSAKRYYQFLNSAQVTQNRRKMSLPCQKR